MVVSRADGVAERAALAARLLVVGERQDDPGMRMMAYGWRVDVLFARGDLAAVAAELENLRWQVARAGGPTASWLLLRYDAALAQARGDFDTAEALAEAAYEAITSMRHPTAFPVRMALMVTLDHHRGADPDAAHVRARLQTGPGTDATPGHAFPIMDYLCPAFVLQEAGYLAEASAKFGALGPAESWNVPPFHELIMYAFGVVVAIRLDDENAVRALRDRLLPLRGRHCVSGTAVEHYLGPVTLYLGTAAAFLGELDTAVHELTDAARTCQQTGAAAHLVEARYELARVLLRRNQPAAARSHIVTALAAAKRLGMRPFVTALSTLDHVVPDPLTARERQVAAQVARGLTNREIAAELRLSERTAQNHVQHVLVKLGFTNHSQITSWVLQEASTATE